MDYRFAKWDVQIIQEPNELMKELKKLNLIGKKIKSIRCVGLCYNLREDIIEEKTYEYYEKRQVSKLDEISEYNNIPADTPFLRYVQIDEPIIFYFEDGDRLEIDFSEGSSLKLGKNSLPEDIEFGTNYPNIDANVIFSNCIGKEISYFEVSMSSELISEFTGSRGIEKPINQDSYISSFRIYLTEWIYIEFNSFFDYGEVAIYEEYKESQILWKDLKKGIIRIN